MPILSSAEAMALISEYQEKVMKMIDNLELEVGEPGNMVVMKFSFGEVVKMTKITDDDDRVSTTAVDGGEQDC